MPAFELCQDDSLFNVFEKALVEYTSIWVSKEFCEDCLAIPNLASVFSFNRLSNARYMRHYLWVFRKSETDMQVDLYNEYVRRGLLDSSHIIGEWNMFTCQPTNLNTLSEQVIHMSSRRTNWPKEVVSKDKFQSISSRTHAMDRQTRGSILSLLHKGLRSGMVH